MQKLERASLSPISMRHWRRIPTFLVLIVYLFFVGFWFLRPESFISDDSYFYLVIARNIVESGQHTFSGLFPTNGVHPAWLYLLTAYSWVVALVSPDLLDWPSFAVPLSGLLLGLGAFNFYRVATLYRIPHALLVLGTVGYLAFFGVLYSEAHLLYFALSWLALLTARTLTEPDPMHKPIALGLAAGLVLLSRLDSVFLVAVFYAWYLAVHRSPRTVLLGGTITAGLLAVYVAANLIQFGGMVPVSGWLKSSFPGLAEKDLLENIGGASMSIRGYSLFFGLLPVAGSGLILLFVGGPYRRSILLPLFLGAVLHITYTCLFTTGLTGWYWYYVVPVASFALAVSFGAAKLRMSDTRLIGVNAAVAIVLVAATFTVKSTPTVRDPQREALQFIESNGIKDSTILVSDYPGVLAYKTENHIIAADMLTGNRRLIEDMAASGNALEYIAAHARSQGAPIEWVFAIGTTWLSPAADRRSVRYYDPRTRRKLIGEAALGEPVKVTAGGGLLIWDVPTAGR